MTDAERIDHISEILSGPERTTIGDRTVEYNFDALRKERADLIAKTRGVSPYKRVVFR